MPKYSIYAADGTPVAIEAYDIRTDQVIQATVFMSYQVASEVLETIPEQVVQMYGPLQIKEVIQA